MCYRDSAGFDSGNGANAGRIGACYLWDDLDYEALVVVLPPVVTIDAVESAAGDENLGVVAAEVDTLSAPFGVERHGTTVAQKIHFLIIGIIAARFAVVEGYSGITLNHKLIAKIGIAFVESAENRLDVAAHTLDLMEMLL